MVMNIVAIILFLGCTLLWAAANMKGRGAYSALLAAVSVVTAGAVALGLWQFLTIDILMGIAPAGGPIENVLWGAGLLIPFIVTLAVLRLTLDSLLRTNIKAGAAVDTVGGIVGGAVSGFILVGFVTLSFNMMRLPAGTLGGGSVSDSGGNLVYNNSLWVPFDELTVRFYEHLSNGALATSTPLATAVPDLHEHAATLRLVPARSGNQLGRVAIGPNDFDVTGFYTLNGPKSELLTDITAPNKVQQATRPGGEQFPEGSTLWGIALKFTPGAVEKGGQVVLSPAHLRLVIENDQTAEVDAIHPIAVITRTDNATDQDGNPREGFVYLRFRVDANGLEFPSVGGDANHFFVPEYLVPPGFTPRTLFVKGVPFPINDPQPIDVRERFIAESGLRNVPDDMPVYRFRDAGVIDGWLLAGVNVPVLIGTDWLDTATASTISSAGTGLRTSTRLPSNWAMTRNTAGGLQINDERQIVSGTHRFEINDLNKTVTRDIRINEFVAARTTTIVHVELRDADGDISEIGDAVLANLGQSAIPILVSEDGQQFQPIGFAYSDGALATIRYTPQDPVERLAELPEEFARQKPGQAIWLFYRVSEGVDIVAMTDSIRQADENQKRAFIAFDPALTVVAPRR